jgi:hypothetical protein
MQLATCEKYKDRVIYIDINHDYYVVYEDKGNDIAREAIHLFVKNDIDINMPIYALHTSKRIIKNDIDVDEIITRGEQKFGLQSWV